MESSFVCCVPFLYVSYDGNIIVVGGLIGEFFIIIYEIQITMTSVISSSPDVQKAEHTIVPFTPDPPSESMISTTSRVRQMLQSKTRSSAAPNTPAMSDNGGVAHSETHLIRSGSTDHVGTSQAPPLESVTSQVIIERLHNLERTMGSLAGARGQTLASSEGYLPGGSVYSGGLSTLPSYDDPPPSWRP